MQIEFSYLPPMEDPTIKYMQNLKNFVSDNKLSPKQNPAIFPIGMFRLVYYLLREVLRECLDAIII